MNLMVMMMLEMVMIMMVVVVLMGSSSVTAFGFNYSPKYLALTYFKHNTWAGAVYLAFLLIENLPCLDSPSHPQREVLSA